MRLPELGLEDFDGDVIHIQRRIYNGKVGPLQTVKSDRWLPVSPELKQRMLAIAGEWIFCSRADGDHGMLDKFVFDSRDRKWTFPSVCFLYLHSSRWLRSIGSAMNPAMKIGQPIL